jgi:hypothetical protein
MGSLGAAKFLARMLSLISRRIPFEFRFKKFFVKLLRPFVNVNSDFLKFSLVAIPTLKIIENIEFLMRTLSIQVRNK